MLRPICLWATIFLLSACVGQEVAKSGQSMTDIEFRQAAATRINWLVAGEASDEVAGNLVKAKIIGLNDFHGNLNGRHIDGRPVGGAAVLAAYLRQEMNELEQRGIIVHAGDMVGASPPVSGLIQDEPTITFLNMLANEHCRRADLMAPKCNLVGTLGNHEFDEGYSEIKRLLYGGRHVDAGMQTGEWAGASFPYVSANVVDEITGQTILQPYVIKEIDGIPIAFIGAVTSNTPTLVGAAGVAGLEFLNEADSINSYVPELVAKNVHAIIVTIHEGLEQISFADAAIVGQNELQGRIIDIVTALDDEIDIVISGHSHDFTNIMVATTSGKNILLTQAFSYGTAYSDINISLDRTSGDIVEISAAVITTWSDHGPGLSPVPAIADLVERQNIAVQPQVSRVVAIAATDITRSHNQAGESALGNLVADSFLAAMDVDFAFAGRGGIRDDLRRGEITWGTLFSVKPFGNLVFAMTLTGKQITGLLAQQWIGRDTGYILQVAGLSYSWDDRRGDDDKLLEIIDAQGTPLQANKSYRVAVSSFLAGGGDNFSMLLEGTDRIEGPLALDALREHVMRLPQPVDAKIEGRIKRINHGDSWNSE